MIYKTLTVAREYGSGGAEIARRTAERLGWRLVDNELIARISAMAEVPVGHTVALDERVDPWLHRMTRRLWGAGGDGVSLVEPVDVLDAERVAAISKQLIEEAYAAGDCVIVGRGAQCVLHGAPGVFHVFVYGSWKDRVNRVRARLTEGEHVEDAILKADRQRRDYVQRYYGRDRMDPHMDGLMIDPHGRPEATAALIELAMRSAG